MKNNYKNDFPIFKNNNIAYLDSAATSQKPQSVLNAVEQFYKTSNANAHRGVYKLSVSATNCLQNARHEVAKFINASKDEEIVFTKNATEAFNLLAYTYGLDNLNENDEVVLSIMEHHSNLVPWQKVCKIKNAKVSYMYINNNYEIPKTELNKITSKTKIVSVTLVSNVLGTINNIEQIINKAHSVGAVVIVDLSQSISHLPFDAKKTDVDFAIFSSHKMYGPLGVGVLYGKYDLLNNLSPFLMGGDMIEYVYEQTSTFASLPNKFEAGTQNVAGIVGLAKAIEYIKKIGYKKILEHEKILIDYTLKKLKELNFVEVYANNNAKNISSVISFNVKGIHPHDISSILDFYNVCVRSGNHCAQPLLRFLKLDSTLRISFAIYNTKEDIDALINGLKIAYEKFKKYIK